MKKFKNQAGFTLAEILVALALIFIAVFTITPLMENSMNNIIEAEEKRQGIGEAQSEIDSTMAEGVKFPEGTPQTEMEITYSSNNTITTTVNKHVVGKNVTGGKDGNELHSFISREQGKAGEPKMSLDPYWIYDNYQKDTVIMVNADEYMSFDEYDTIGLFEKDKKTKISSANCEFKYESSKQKKLILKKRRILKEINSPYYVIAQNAKNDTVEAELSVIKKPNIEPEFMIGGKMGNAYTGFKYQELDKDGKWGKTQSSNIQSGINFFGMSRAKDGTIQWRPIPFEDSDELKKENITEINNIAWDGEHYVAATDEGLFYKKNGYWKMINKNKDFSVKSIGGEEKNFQVTKSEFVLNCSNKDGKSYFGAGNALFTLNSNSEDKNVKGVVYGNGPCTCATEFTYKGKNYLLVCFSNINSSRNKVNYSQIIFIDTETDGISKKSLSNYKKNEGSNNHVGFVVDGIVWYRNTENPSFIAIGQIRPYFDNKNSDLKTKFNRQERFISRIGLNNNDIDKGLNLGEKNQEQINKEIIYTTPNKNAFKDPVICFGYDNLGQGVYFFDTSLRTFQLTQNELNNLNNNEIQERIDYIETNLFGSYSNKDIVYVEKIINAPGDIDNKFVAVASERKGPRVLEFKGISDLLDNRGDPDLTKSRIEGSPGSIGSLPSTFQPQAVAGMVVE